MTRTPWENSRGLARQFLLEFETYLIGALRELETGSLCPIPRAASFLFPDFIATRDKIIARNVIALHVTLFLAVFIFHGSNRISVQRVARASECNWRSDAAIGFNSLFVAGLTKLPTRSNLRESALSLITTILCLLYFFLVC